jgi:hypothetical protein
MSHGFGIGTGADRQDTQWGRRGRNAVTASEEPALDSDRALLPEEEIRLVMK